MDFKGIVKLDNDVVIQLNRFLKEKESELGLKILESIGPIQSDYPELEVPEIKSLALSDAVMLFGKKVRSLILNKEFKETKQLHDEINEKMSQNCWNYLELLENCVSELFLQIDSTKCDEWNAELLENFQSIKMLLLHHLDDLEWAVKRLNGQLWQLHHGALEKTFFGKLKNIRWFFESNIKISLLKNLKKTRKYLLFYGGKFREYYEKYHILQKIVEPHVSNLENYKTLNSEQIDTKDAFTKVYKYLKMWEINQHSKLIPNKEIEDPLKTSIDPKRMSHLFEEYQNSLLKKMFEISGGLKFEKNGIENLPIKNELENASLMLLKEVLLLSATVAKYREFLLKTDQDPYVRCRFGFPEWIVGEEPATTKNMLLINYELEEMNGLVEKMIHALETGEEGHEKIKLKNAHLTLEPLLHEMAQPLASEATMKDLIVKALQALEELHELTSHDLEVVDFVGNSLSKILKSDWKYQVLFTIPEFEKIYAMHIGILGGRHENRLYLNRLDELRRLSIELKDLIKTKSFYTNHQEIEFTISDIKGSLQDFLGYVQRISKGSDKDKTITVETVRDVSVQLLEVRYFFGHYLHDLLALKDGNIKVLDKLLFVDQYLDAIDNVIGSIKVR